MGTFSARGPRGVRVNVAEGNGKMFPHPFEKGRAKDECEGRAFGWTTTWCWNDASGRVVILVARFWGHHPCHSRG